MLSGKEVHTLYPVDTNKTYLPFWNSGLEYEAQTYDTDGATLLETKTSTWQQRPCQANDRIPCSFYTTNINPAHDPQVSAVTTTYGTQSAQTQMGYDSYNNPTSVKVNGYDGKLIRTTSTSYSTSANFPNQSSYLAQNLVSLPWVQTITDGSGQQSQTTYTYDGSAPQSEANIINSAYPNTFLYRGNPTTISRWLYDPVAQTATTAASTLTFDVAGNVVKLLDPRGVETDFSYADSSNTYAFPTTVTHYPSVGKTTPALTETYVWDDNIGKVTKATDVNSQSTSFTYDDDFDRILTASYPDDGQTTFTYVDTPGSISAAESRTQSTVAKDVVLTTTNYDGLGRKSETILSEGTGNGIQTNFLYDYRGRLSQVSNPYRTASASAYTTSAYDGLGRTTSVTQPDGAVTQTIYLNNQSLTIDPAKVNRLYTYDAASRLTQVQENATTLGSTTTYGIAGQPTYSTTYLYNGLDELLSVTQGGGIANLFVRLPRPSEASREPRDRNHHLCVRSERQFTNQDRRPGDHHHNMGRPQPNHGQELL